MRDKEKAAALNKLVDKPWALCDTSKGFDCLNAVKSYYEDLGFNWNGLKTWEGYDWQNYAKVWDENPSKAKRDMLRFLRLFGTEVKPGFYRRGDLLILKVMTPSKTRQLLNTLGDAVPKGFSKLRRFLQDRRPEAFPAIYLGNGHIFAVFDVGGKVLPYRAFKPFIIECRRYIG